MSKPLTAQSTTQDSARKPGRHGLPASDHRLLLRTGDFFVSVIGVATALVMWSITAGFPFSLSFITSHALWFLAAPIWCLAIAPTRNPRHSFSIIQTSRLILHATAVFLMLYLAVYFFASRQALPRLMIVHFLWETPLLTLAWRLAYVWVFTETAWKRRVIIVGAGRAARTIAAVMRGSNWRHMDLLGHVSSHADRSNDEWLGEPILGEYTDLAGITRKFAVSEVIVALDGPASQELVHALVECQEYGIAVVRMPVVYEAILERVPVTHLEPDWIVTSFIDAVRMREASWILKRTVDIAGAFAGLLVFAVLAPFVAVAILVESGLPVFIRQTRVGRGGRLFPLIKFRTMIQQAESDGKPQWSVRDDPRVTRVGQWLRRTRLDELPQMINILTGEMSLVGPRPERPEFVQQLERRIPFYRTRLLVRPGLTGWAQVKYAYTDSAEDAIIKLEYDLYYIKHRSFLFDAWIAMRTLETVITFKGR